MRNTLLRLLLLALALIFVCPLSWADALTLEGCRSGIEQNPRNPAAYYCVYRWVLGGGDQLQASHLLSRYFRENPGVFRIEMFIAWIDHMGAGSLWEQSLRDSIEGMERTGDAWGVVYGGLYLAFELGERGDFQEAESLLEGCTRAADQTGDAGMKTRVLLSRAELAGQRGDYSTRLHLCLKARKGAFSGVPEDLRKKVLNSLGAAYWYLCRYQEAFEAFHGATVIGEEATDLQAQAREYFNMALCGASLLGEGEMEQQQFFDLLQRARELADQSGNQIVESNVEILLGQQKEGSEALAHFQRAAELARERGDVAVEIQALRFSAKAENGMGPSGRKKAESLLTQAEAKAGEAGQSFELAEALAMGAWMAALDGSRDEAVSAHLRALDSIESLRSEQLGGSLRAQSFSHWAFVYYRLAGVLLAGLDDSGSPKRDSALAFRTMERFRARELLESLELPPMQTGDFHDDSKPYQDILKAISRLQRRLSDPSLDPGKRRQELGRLKDLEEDEARLRDEIPRGSGRPAALDRVSSGDLSSIQALLGPDQALLSFQLWDGESERKPPLEIGRSWLTAVSREQVRVYALPSRRDLRSRVEILGGLLEARDARDRSGIRASVRLYQDLVRDALDDLGGEFHRLVIIPDDALFRCPFGVLRPTETAPPIGTRYEISILPSAAVWAVLKKIKRDPGSGAALMLCNPELAHHGGEAADFRAAEPWIEGLKVAPLAHAAEEVRALRRVAGPDSLVLTGAEASEAALKQRPLGRFHIIDLVTHAVVDENQPERSAILLAPGSKDEDGFLQVREIPGLKLGGQLVILSSCRSSAGPLLGGEGAQSLARAFLKAGAGAVISSLWPLEDQNAAEFFSNFSSSLGRGLSVGEALRRAKAKAVHAGMPAADWAGIILSGDGDLRPLPASKGMWWILLPILLLSAASVLLIRRKRRG